MADFASITDGSGLTFWINLEFVYRIDVGLDPQEPMTVIFSDGKSMSLPRQEGEKLIAQLNLCCEPSPTTGSAGSSQPKRSQRKTAAKTGKKRSSKRAG